MSRIKKLISCVSWRTTRSLLVIFFRCLESFILFWVKLWFCSTRDWDLFSNL